MSRLIDADELKAKAYDEASKMNNSLAELGTIVDWLVSKCSTIDAEPVRHGHWICSDYDECSVCGHMELGRTPYCPNCGAKMEEVKE